MKIGVNTLFFVPGDVGGTETYLRETLVAAVSEYPAVEFILFTNIENNSLFTELFADKDNVRCVCLHFRAAIRPLRILLEQFLLPLTVKKHCPDILWSPGYTAPFFSSCPQVVTVCDLQYKRFPEDMSRLERATLDFLVRGACRQCDAVLTISEFSRQELIAFNFADNRKAFTHLLGVDSSFGVSIAEDEKQQCLQKFSLTKPYILCVAHSYPHKKLEVLIEAFAQIEEDIPHNLVVVGRQRRGEHFLNLALKSLKNKGRYVRFNEGLPYRTLQIFFQSADMFVLPSAYEGFGLPIIEAMLAGVPVVTTQEGALKEVSGGYAFCVDRISSQDFAEQMLKVSLLSTEERGTKVLAAKQWAKSFTWQKSAQNMFDVFNKVINKPIETTTKKY
ncbi:MAG: glycosyltransferase family 4 protein [Proteobacteria bacterium]|nr:glycosyltransferase family 4 protein [Pseudomonadota bacterium]